MDECKHPNLEGIGQYTEHHPKAMNVREIRYCPDCQQAFSYPVMFLDLVRKETPDELIDLQDEQKEHYRALIAEVRRRKATVSA